MRPHRLLPISFLFNALTLALPFIQSHTRALSDVPQFVLDFGQLQSLEFVIRECLP